MRPIKFRAWDNKESRMIDGCVGVYPLKGPPEWSISGDGIMIRPDSGRFTLIQFTGLLDKNDVEIYEGDIVQIDDMGDFWLAEIIFHESCFVYKSKNLYWHGETIESLKTEIIGNIHENSELLEK